MKRAIAAILATFFTVGCSAAAQDRAHMAKGDILIMAQFENAQVQAQRGDARGVMMSLQPAMQDDIFVQLSPQKQYAVAELFARAAEYQGLWEAAYPAFIRVTASSEASAEDWDGRLQGAILVGDGADALLTFQHLTALHVPVLQTFNGRQIDRLDRLLGDLPEGGKARLALGREMEAETWQPPYVFNDPSLVRLHYAEALLADGDAKKAAAVAGQITDPAVVMTMHADRRFDNIVRANPALADPAAAARRYLEAAQAYARENPRMLSGRIAVVRALSILNRPVETLAAVEETVDAMTAGSHEAPAFDDMEQAAIFEGWRAAALVGIGRLDAGIGGLATAAACHCSAISQLELGRTLMEAGKPQEARRWLKDGGANSLGLEDRMALSQTRACVDAQLNDSAGLATELAFLRAHEAWKPGATIGALVCANQLDAAAAALAKQVEDPRSRLAALSLLQIYAPAPGDRPYALVLRARWARLTAMPIVQAEVAKVGRINHYDLLPLDAVA